MSSQANSSGLVAFDVDGTLIGHESGSVVWQILNRRFGCDPKINQERYRAYLNQEITYAQWVDLDIQGWVDAGADRFQIEETIKAHLYLMPGARQTVDALHVAGYRLAVISGTLDLTLDLLFPDHPFEIVYTNQIWFDEDQKIAGWKATPYDMDGKAQALVDIARQMQVPIHKTVYIGDNINDIQVMNIAGISIAFEPKDETVQKIADYVVNGDLRGILSYLLGGVPKVRTE